jgi:hypothetical protein
VFDSQRVSRFQLLQDMQVEPSYAVFDCLYKNGQDLRARPLAARREELEKVVGITAARRKQIFPSARLASNGLEAFQLVRKKGYEGVVAKDASAPYVEGRSNKWLKIKVRQEDEFLIVGYSRPQARASILAPYCSQPTIKVSSDTWASWVLDSTRKRSQTFTAGFSPSCAKRRRSQTRRGIETSSIWLLVWSRKLPMRNSPPIGNCGSPSSSACVTTNVPKTSHCRKPDES